MACTRQDFSSPVFQTTFLLIFDFFKQSPDCISLKINVWFLTRDERLCKLFCVESYVPFPKLNVLSSMTIQWGK